MVRFCGLHEFLLEGVVCDMVRRWWRGVLRVSPCQAGVVLPLVDRNVDVGTVVEVGVGGFFRDPCVCDDVFDGGFGDADMLGVGNNSLLFVWWHAREFSVEGQKVVGDEGRKVVYV